jgi:hypothetical protein
MATQFGPWTTGGVQRVRKHLAACSIVTRVELGRGQPLRRTLRGCVSGVLARAAQMSCVKVALIPVADVGAETRASPLW